MRALFLTVSVLALLQGTAQAEPFLRLIERPLVRFLLTETSQGRSIVNQVLGRTGPITSTEVRNFAATLDGNPRWSRFSLELEDRVGSAQDLLVAMRERAIRLGTGMDAVEFLRRYAVGELEASTVGLFGSRRFAFTNRAGTSIASVREEFIAEASDGFQAALLLESEVASLAARIVSMEVNGAERAALPSFISTFRNVSLEVSVQSMADVSAYSAHRGLLSGLRPRLRRVIDAAYASEAGEVTSLADVRARNALRAEVEEIGGWFAAAPRRVTP